MTSDLMKEVLANRMELREKLAVTLRESAKEQLQYYYQMDSAEMDELERRIRAQRIEHYREEIGRAEDELQALEESQTEVGNDE